ncbi:DNA polymerase III subunit delta [Sphingomicrobium astaxanthinifaciens]|uniref:DNA polymerase III subunit delta n=1 Tax=Sphingomicrobium astaxanthinifaciens TaxID=1227949 RepID=UPI001FCB3601|nr:hypothetical protein [Sphingomicrobium astaxanthinifaciens]MCJ7421182.1 hypothetical protein [Sphingomicrobium astaxanthinifaciens]
MKAKATDIAQFLKRDPLRLYLFHGVDVSGSRAAAAKLAAALGGERSALDPGGFKGDPGRLVDEAAGAGLFGDAKLIWLEPVGNELLPAADALLGAPTTEYPVIAIGGTLAKSSKLLKLVESSQDAVALVSYEPSRRDLVRDVAALFTAKGLHPDPGVPERIAETCDLNRDLAAREIEKLALFVAPETQVTHEAIDAVGAAYGVTEWMAVGDSAMDGDIAAVEAALGAVSPQASEAVLVWRAVQRRVQQLLPLAARIAAGESSQQVIASQGRALFWKDKPLVARLLDKWPARQLDRVAARAVAAERAAMLEPGSKRAALGEELLAIARAARRRR